MISSGKNERPGQAARAGTIFIQAYIAPGGAYDFFLETSVGIVTSHLRVRPFLRFRGGEIRVGPVRARARARVAARERVAPRRRRRIKKATARARASARACVYVSVRACARACESRVRRRVCARIAIARPDGCAR